jgi:multidrug efflux system outer membrane protein
MTRILKHTRFLLCALFIGMAGLTGCAVGPNYRRPTVDVPGTYRGSTSGEGAEASPTPETETQAAKAVTPPQPSFSLGDEKWWEIFQDPQLQSLIRTALKNNYDVRIAATRVLQAQATRNHSRRPASFVERWW